jgi:hypothetical protein
MLALLARIVLALALVAVGVWAAGLVRWRALTRRRRNALHAHARAGSAAAPSVASDAELPVPVARYLSLAVGHQPRLVRTARIRHGGQFRMSDSPAGWRPFQSEQWVTVLPPGMLWNARIRMNPALTTRVHDAYHGGEGLLHATLLGLVTVARRSGSRPLAEAELMRYLAEAVWYPTALLPVCGVRWEAVDASTARATLADGPVTASLEFVFGADGLVESVRSPARYRGERNGEAQFRPWRGHFASYGEWGGMRIPAQGEVAWELDGRDVAYWRGRIRSIEFGYGD